MKRIPLEKRLKAAVTGKTFFLGAFYLFSDDYFYTLQEMTCDERFEARYKELRTAFPEYESKPLAEIVYESIEQSKEHCIDLLYVMLVEPFTEPLHIVNYEEDF